ncbi:hypothetical protein [Nonomuraea rhodomycinica]|uniref:Uncharacterized protein n=1 Tax=Nonomuraea rhodomycinica TaxID=1712872 RepID=A0A7Y6IST5_9ACTN|nr:hypothetical protein [Nonomuraea rhodomycinica]NUW43193.1 hypothetical protein [Nonomuraea rhodomycinica]
MTGPIAAYIPWVPTTMLLSLAGISRSPESVSLVPIGAFGHAAKTWVMSTAASWWSGLAVVGLVVMVF